MGLHQALKNLRTQLKKRGASEEEVTAALLAAAKLVASHTLLVSAIPQCQDTNNPVAESDLQV